MTLPDYADVVEKTLSLGFDHVRSLRVPDIQEEGLRLEAWLNQDYHADMQWMVTHLDKRRAPESLMPETQTILCVTMNYYPGKLPQEPSDLKIARYALGDDYHNILKERLKELLGWLKSINPEIEGRPLVDSAPILEKALAVKAGIGWQGKHSNLITRDKGSWVFLGELLLNVTFPNQPEPEPIGDFCGTCRRCIEACPTEAIVSDKVVDARKCISYWTIEYKGDEIPETIAEHLNGWLFGCDICQEVCPWNLKFQQPTSEVAFLPRPWNLRPKPNDILTLTPEAFRVRYRKSPLKRTKLSGLQRNLAALKKQRLNNDNPI